MCSMLGERIPCIVYVEFFRRSLWVRILQEENALHGKITRSVVREHLLCIYVRAYIHACAGMPFLHGLTAMVYVCVRVCGCRCTYIHHAYQHTHTNAHAGRPILHGPTAMVMCGVERTPMTPQLLLGTQPMSPDMYTYVRTMYTYMCIMRGL